MVDSKGIACIGCADIGIHQRARWFMHMPLACAIMIRSPLSKTKKQAVGLLFVLVDSKGIEPSNLTDANRALSQLSYEPMFILTASTDSFCIITQFLKK